MTEGEVFVRYISFPYTVKGVTLPNDDGTFSIYINSVLPEPQQREALRHELSHVRDGHFYDCAPVNENELSAQRDRSPVPRDALVFARGGGLVTGRRRRRLLTMLDATVDVVLARMDEPMASAMK